MIARAPGKLILSGSYSVLVGAPAIVAAVDRYAWADGERRATLVTDEVAEALQRGLLPRAPWFDASALRHSAPGGAPGPDRKLGLGSSAAILVASLGCVRAEPGAPASLAGEIFPDALAVHRAAQGGGSGADVAASCFGGVLRFALRGPSEPPSVDASALPDGMVLSAYACPTAASTRRMLDAVGTLRAREPARYGQLLERAGQAAERLAGSREAAVWQEALGDQWRTLAALGEAAGVDIVTAPMAELGGLAEREGGLFVPTGAGGGDVALFVAGTSPSPAWQERATALGLTPLSLRLGAPGLSSSRSAPTALDTQPEEIP
jgi:phosphomevalonate kinase